MGPSTVQRRRYFSSAWCGPFSRTLTGNWSPLHSTAAPASHKVEGPTLDASVVRTRPPPQPLSHHSAPYPNPVLIARGARGGCRRAGGGQAVAHGHAGAGRSGMGVSLALPRLSIDTFYCIVVCVYFRDLMTYHIW